MLLIDAIFNLRHRGIILLEATIYLSLRREREKMRILPKIQQLLEWRFSDPTEEHFLVPGLCDQYNKLSIPWAIAQREDGQPRYAE